MPRPILALALLLLSAPLAACSSSTVVGPNSSGQGGSGQGGAGAGGSGEGGSGQGGFGQGGSGQGGACAEGESLLYDMPGCGPEVQPVCSLPPPPCADPFCGCNGQTIYGCGLTAEKYQFKGACEDGAPKKPAPESP
ncbi:hypothetical protein [Chondromyces apiculatus]|uniref:Uncharacterized protein n=1 Tax=Chondromyces apiculatus DSM 436 TaxID=1192034 RepID=A0A017TH93_9BACT|nr:hypothetical protein [Chondromyces apiculatus]EYF08200.1 Hypothetical protein CAP_5960 [Chondromyces apiculatus DSM 436]